MQVEWLALKESIQLAALGAALGLPLSIAASRLLETQLYGVAPGDLFSRIVALAILGASALTASLIPAFRASRVDPVQALRCSQ